MGNILDSPEAAPYRDLLKRLLDFHDTDASQKASIDYLKFALNFAKIS